MTMFTSPSQDSPAAPRRRWRPLVFRWRFWAVLWLVYFLSAGPMYWYVFEAFYLDGPKYWAKLYLPLALLSEVPGVGQLLNWYVALWVF